MDPLQIFQNSRNVDKINLLGCIRNFPRQEFPSLIEIEIRPMWACCPHRCNDCICNDLIWKHVIFTHRHDIDTWFNHRSFCGTLQQVWMKRTDTYHAVIHTMRQWLNSLTMNSSSCRACSNLIKLSIFFHSSHRVNKNVNERPMMIDAEREAWKKHFSSSKDERNQI